MQTTTARLVLEDGTEYVGRSPAPVAAVAGEVVFNTAMTGYPEGLTDPSYAGQILVQTNPLIGNYGVPGTPVEPGRFGSFQSSGIQVQALVVQRLSVHYSHHASWRSLAEWFAESEIPLLTDIDTRALTQTLRERGTMRGWVFADPMTLAEAQRSAQAVGMRDEVFRRVAPAAPVHYPGGDLRVLVIDTGVKLGIVECLLERGASVLRAPWHADLRRLAEDVDAIMLGNGPGDPADLGELTAQVRALLANPDRPIFGVCLGHQILARAAGCSTYKLPYGHRGANQPVQDLTSGRCYVTSQNHGYAVEGGHLPGDLEPWFVNLNDRTNEGLRWRNRPVSSVQFHPEGRPGPRDTEFLFDDFLRLTGAMRATRTA